MTEFAYKWTQAAKECYERGCNCRGCLMKNLESHCQMKKAVFELVRKFGKPPEESNLNKTQQSIIDAILAGCNSKQDIAKYIDREDYIVQQYLTELYTVAESDGVFFRTRKKLEQFINWVRGVEDEL